MRGVAPNQWRGDDRQTETMLPLVLISALLNGSPEEGRKLGTGSVRPFVDRNY